MNPRLRRLRADQQRLLAAFAGHPHIRVEPVGPPPPEQYRIVYNVPGLHRGAEGSLVTAHQHVVELNLLGGYPREKPYSTSTSPVFHPNFGNYVCIADFWSPGQALTDVVVQIGDMLQYKLYNTSSPLNALAARWAVENIAELPIGDIELQPVEPEIQLGELRTPAPVPKEPSS